MSTDILTERNKAYSEGIALGERRGRQEGLQEGLHKGALATFVKMVKIGIIPVSVACEQLGITEKEFNKFLSTY